MIVDYESTRPAPFPGSPGWPPAVRQLTFTPSDTGDGYSLGDVAPELFLHGDGTVHTIRVDSFEP